MDQSAPIIQVLEIIVLCALLILILITTVHAILIVISARKRLQQHRQQPATPEKQRVPDFIQPCQRYHCSSTSPKGYKME